MPSHRRLAIPPFAAMLAVALAGCAPAARSSASPAASTASVAPAVAARPDPVAIEKAYQTDAYVRINAEPKPGTGPHGDQLYLYVDRAHADLYRRGFQGEMPAGTILVKATQAPGQVFTIMAKLPAGTDPAAGDWFYWERYNGSVVFDGKPGGGLCYNCHQSAKASDYMLGLSIFAP